MRTFTLASATDSIDWNTGTPDADGCYWIARDLEGWDGADISLDLQQRLRTPGQMITAGNVLGRTLSVTGGWLLAPTEVVRRTAVDRLQAILHSIASEASAGLVTVHDPDGSGGTLDRRCAVASNQRPISLDQPPTVGDIGGIGGLGITWPSLVTWRVLAVDPVRYADTASNVTYASVTPVVVTNDGTAPADAVLTLSGPGSPVSLIHAESGRTIVLAGSMPGSLTIDLRERTVVDGGGTDRYDLVTSTPNQWWQLGAGVNTVTVSGANGDITWRSAWW